MPKYTFTFKKDDIFVEFTTEDKEVTEMQFQIWVAAADDYINKRSYSTAKSFSADISTSESKEPPAAKENINEEVKNVQQPEVLDKASDLLRTINSIQNPPPEGTSAPVPEFNEILDKTAETIENIETSAFEPKKAKDQVFLNLVKSKNTADKFHYLMITAYYLSEFEKMERFSLKQINAKLMDNLSEIIDHAILQEAINQNLIELVPDLTGISETDEYRITREGEDFFLNKI